MVLILTFFSTFLIFALSSSQSLLKMVFCFIGLILTFLPLLNSWVSYLLVLVYLGGLFTLLVYVFSFSLSLLKKSSVMVFLIPLIFFLQYQDFGSLFSPEVSFSCSEFWLVLFLVILFLSFLLLSFILLSSKSVRPVF